MARKKRTPEENARREKIRELLQMANIGSMDDIQSLFKETIAEFMEKGLDKVPVLVSKLAAENLEKVDKIPDAEQTCRQRIENTRADLADIVAVDTEMLEEILFDKITAAALVKRAGFSLEKPAR